ncbi:MAG: hypothetical protein ACQGQO_03610 [Sphaerochaetaceae bacterium]
MKKITAIIMVMAIAIATVFAVTNPANNTLTLNYDVNDKVTLAYGFKMAGDSTDTEKTTFDAGSSDGKIAEATKTFSIIDHSYYNAASGYSLKIEIGDPTIWTNTVIASETGSDPSVSNLAAGTSTTTEDGVVLSVSGKSVTVAYPAVTTKAGIINRVSADDGEIIATFTITWADAEVAAGTYQSIATVTYTTVS